MTKRLITFTLVFFFLFSSLGYACPELNGFSKQQHDSSFDEMASDENPCEDADHEANPLCQYILHDRISYPSPNLSLDKVISRIVFHLTGITSGFAASPTVSRTASASGFHSKLPLTFLYRILRV